MSVFLSVCAREGEFFPLLSLCSERKKNEKKSSTLKKKKKTLKKKTLCDSLHQHRLQHRGPLPPDLRARAHPLCAPGQTHQPGFAGGRRRDRPRAFEQGGETRARRRGQAPGGAPPRGLRAAREEVGLCDGDHAQREGDGLGEAGEVSGDLLGAGKREREREREIFLALFFFFFFFCFFFPLSSLSSSPFNPKIPTQPKTITKTTKQKGILPLLRRDRRVLRLLPLRRARHERLHLGRLFALAQTREDDRRGRRPRERGREAVLLVHRYGSVPGRARGEGRVQRRGVEGMNE